MTKFMKILKTMGIFEMKFQDNRVTMLTSYIPPPSFFKILFSKSLTADFLKITTCAAVY